MKKIKILLIGLAMALLSTGLFACDLLSITDEDVSALKEQSTQEWKPLTSTKSSASASSSSRDSASASSSSVDELSAEDSSVEDSVGVDSSVDSSSSASDDSSVEDSSVPQPEPPDDSTGVETISYEITFTAQTGGTVAATYDGGVLTSGDTLPAGESVTFEATASEGYSFVSWTVNGVTDSTENGNTLTFTMPASAVSVTASFAKNTYQVTFGVHENVGGAVATLANTTDPVSVEHGNELTLKATPDTGYAFQCWYVNGTETSGAATQAFAITGETTITAAFELAKYDLTVNLEEGEDMGSLSVTDKDGNVVLVHSPVAYTTELTFEATAYEGYSFVGWTVNGVTDTTENGNTLTFIMPANAVTVTANFEACSYVVDFAAATGGSVTATAGGISFNSGAEKAYGTELVFTASATTDGYSFVGWTVDGVTVVDTAANPLTITMPARAVTVTANFSLSSHEVCYATSDETMGTVTAKLNNEDFASGSSAYYGEVITFYATAEEGYSFVGWYNGDTELSTNSMCEHTVTDAITITAKFSETPVTKCQVTFSAYEDVGGTVTSTGGNSPVEVTEGATIQLTATPATGYTFKCWYVNGTETSGAATQAFVITGETTITAVFALATYDVSYEATNGSITVDGCVEKPTSVTHGEQITLTATADSGYEFDYWIINTEISYDATKIITVTAATSVTAVFKASAYDVTATVNDTKMGSVTSVSSATYETTVTLTATANEGYEFVGWTVNGVTDTAENGNTLTFTMPANAVTVTANFKAIAYAITYQAENGTILVNGDTAPATISYGTTVTFTPSPNEGYEFVSWSLGGTTFTTEELSCEINGETTIIATFALKTYQVAVVIDGETTTYTASHGVPMSLSTPMKAGYTFNGWVISGNGVISDGELIATGDVTVTAQFTAIEYTVTVIVDDTTNTYTKYYEDTVTLEEPAKTGYTFNGWDISGNGEITEGVLTVYGDVTVTAQFTAIEYTVTVIVDGTTNTYTRYYEATVTLEEPAKTGYTFDGWYVDGELLSSESSYEYKVTGNVTITAQFTAIEYTVTVNVDDTMGSVTGGGKATYGTTVTLTASSLDESQFEFVGWYVNGELFSSESSCVYAVTGDVTIEATFQVRTYTVTFGIYEGVGSVEASYADENGENVSISSGDKIPYGTTVYFTATTTDDRYEFAGWYIDGSKNDAFESDSFDYTMEGDVEIEASFTPKAVLVTLDTSIVAANNRADAVLDTTTTETAVEVSEVSVNGESVATYSLDATTGALTIENSSIKGIMDALSDRSAGNVVSLTVVGKNAIGAEVTYSGEMVYYDFVIGSADELKAFLQYNDENGETTSSMPYTYVILDADIDYAGGDVSAYYDNVNSANNLTTRHAYFYGCFDGRGHTISNFSTVHGLLPQITGRDVDGSIVYSTIQNLALVNVQKNTGNGGGLLSNAINRAKIDNVYVSGIMSKYVAESFGCLAFEVQAYSIVSNCVVCIEVTSGQRYNAFATSVASTAEITNCYAISSTSNGYMYDGVTDGLYTSLSAFKEAVTTLPDGFNECWEFSDDGLLTFATATAFAVTTAEYTASITGTEVYVGEGFTISGNGIVELALTTETTGINVSGNRVLVSADCAEGATFFVEITVYDMITGKELEVVTSEVYTVVATPTATTTTAVTVSTVSEAIVNRDQAAVVRLDKASTAITASRIYSVTVGGKTVSGSALSGSGVLVSIPASELASLNADNMTYTHSYTIVVESTSGTIYSVTGSLTVIDYAIGTVDELDTFLTYYSRNSCYSVGSTTGTHMPWTYAILTSSIDYGGESISDNNYLYTLNGTTNYHAAYFFGTFDGMGYTISNFSTVHGLFPQLWGGEVTINGTSTYVPTTIQNLALVNVVKNTANGGGIFANQMKDTVIENVYIQGTRTNYSNAIGPVFASHSGGTVTLTNVVVDVEWDSTSTTGACYAFTSMEAPATGSTKMVELTNCYAISATSNGSLYNSSITSTNLTTTNAALYETRSAFAAGVTSSATNFDSYWTYSSTYGWIFASAIAYM